MEALACPRCQTAMRFIGTKKFHEGTRAWGFVLGDLGELLTKRINLDVYACPRCGRVELFLDGVGEHLRTTSSKA